MRTMIRVLVAGCAIGLYLASMVLPTAAPFTTSDTTYPGYVAFESATASTRDPAPSEIDWWLLGLAWLANPAIWLGIWCVLCGNWRAGAIEATGGVLLALAPLPRYHEVFRGLPGYPVWLGSAEFLLAACAIAVVSDRRPGDKEINHDQCLSW